MNSTPEHVTEITSTVTTSWVIEWTCPRCQHEMLTTIYGFHYCTCGQKFDIRKQPYASKTPAYVVQLPMKIPQVPNWPAVPWVDQEMK